MRSGVEQHFLVIADKNTKKRMREGFIDEITDPKDKTYPIFIVITVCIV